MADSRYIVNIEDYKRGLPLVNALRAVEYSPKNNDNPRPQRRIGFVSQEVQAIEPMIVYGSTGNGLSIQYDKLIPILVNAIKELSNEVEILKANQVLKPAEITVKKKNTVK